VTRDEFVKKAVRAHEKVLGIPEGWWGDYHEIRNERVLVRWSRSATCWIVYGDLHWDINAASAAVGAATTPEWREVSRHDSRSNAISKARKWCRS